MSQDSDRNECVHNNGNVCDSGGNVCNSGVNVCNSGGNVCNSGGNVCNSGGNVCDSGGNVCNSGEIEYGLGNLRVEIVIHNFDRLPIRVHGITCKNPIRI